MSPAALCYVCHDYCVFCSCRFSCVALRVKVSPSDAQYRCVLVSLIFIEDNRFVCCNLAGMNALEFTFLMPCGHVLVVLMPAVAGAIKLRPAS
jgi:hypothetical protein